MISTASRLALLQHRIGRSLAPAPRPTNVEQACAPLAAAAREPRQPPGKAQP
jgi:hypothetical protein